MHGFETEQLRKQHIEGVLAEIAGLEQALDRANDEQRANIERHIEVCRQRLREFGHRAAKPAERAEKRPRPLEVDVVRRSRRVEDPEPDEAA